MTPELQKVIDDFEAKTNNKLVYLTKSGSKLYGTDTPSSDTDYKGIFIPSRMDILLKKDISNYTHDTNNTKEKNTSEDIDFSIHSVYAFFNQLKKSETGAVDVLFSMFREDTIVYENKDFTNSIKNNYKHFLNKNMKSFIGYALGQTKKFGIKGARYEELDTFVREFFNTIPLEAVSKSDKIGELLFDNMKTFIKAKEYKYIKFIMAPGPRGSGTYKDVEYISVLGKMFEGNVSSSYFMERVMKLYDQFGNRTKTIAKTTSKTDFKALSHSLRIALEVEELLETDFINFPITKADYIRDIKIGKIPVEKAIDDVQDVLNNVDILLLKSELPEESNEELMDSLILHYISSHYLESEFYKKNNDS